MRSLTTTIALLLLVGVARADLDLEDLRASVVQIELVSQSENYWEPWQRPGPSGSGGSGFYIGEKRLMTNAHVVTEAKVLRVKRPDRPERYEARVLFIAHDCDLAMITVDEPGFFDGMVPMQFGEVPALRSTVAAVGYPVGGRKISITEGVVSRIELHDYVHSGADRHLTIQVDAAINPGNSGGPVIQGDKVVGVAFQTRGYDQNIGYMIPMPVIRHFLDDIEDGAYDGYPMLGVTTSSLENETLREWLKVPEGETGVVVLKALPHSSCEGLLRKNDVLHAVDEHRIENDGTVKIGDEFLELAFVVQEKQVGDTAELSVRRDGKLLTIPVTLRKWGVKMGLGMEYGKRPEYLVYGGYIFVPVTSNYVARVGWRSNLRYWHREFYRELQDSYPGQEQLIVLSRVLPHDSTRYRSYNNAVVKGVNGAAPRDFRDFVEKVTGADRAVIEFEGVNVAPVVLDRERVREVQEEILERFGIPEDRFVREEE